MPLIRFAIGLVVAGLVLAACGGSEPSTSPAAVRALQNRVLTLPPGSYRAGPSDALDADGAAAATVVPPDVMHDFLAGHPLRAGYARVWTYQDSYLTAVALEFDGSGDAAALVNLALGHLRSALGTYLAALPGVPGGTLYALSGKQRVSGHYLFCSGAWFATGATAYTVTECSTERPVAISTVQPYARLQYQQAAKRTH
jgi:hypothetical protein